MTATAEPRISRKKLAKAARLHPTPWALMLTDLVGDGNWRNAAHFDYLAERFIRLRDEADRVRAGGKPSDVPGSQRLCVSLPPGFGKSEYLSLACASWWLGTRPNDRVVIASYAKNLAVGWGARARNAFAQVGAEVFGVTSDIRQKAEHWHPRDPITGKASHGFLLSVGRGGSLNGKRAELLIVDDLLKDDDEAQSEAIRKSAWGFLETVALTRQMPWTVVIQIATRWHHDDPIGRLEVKQEKGEIELPWEFVNLPALCDTENDPMGREIGESLWPEMWTSERLEMVKRGKSPRVWSALFQGRPSVQGGGMIRPEWLVGYSELDDGTLQGKGREPVRPERLVKFATIDLAYTTKMTSDYTVVCVWGADLAAGDLYLLHVERDRIGAEDLAARIGAVFDAWGVRKGYLERSGFYADIVRELRKKLPLSLIQPNTDKVARAQPAVACMASGALLVRRAAPWIDALKAELEQFPDGSHDDQVDALAYGVHVFNALARRGQSKSRYRKKGA